MADCQPEESTRLMVKARRFDEMIGRLDRVLSEFLVEADSDLDQPDTQTLKHHADDLIGVGQKALQLLKVRKDGNAKRTVSKKRR